jgi:hypothetical protein
MRATAASVPVRGATYAATSGRSPSGAGSARRSTFPFSFTGSLSNSTHAPGCMYPGRCRSRCCRNSRTLPRCSPRQTTYATNCWSPRPVARAATTACATPSCSPSRASISPNSMRKPRSFTCWSIRPRYSSSPVLPQRTRSPVRYNRSPAWNGSATTAPPSTPAHSNTLRQPVSPGTIRLSPGRTTRPCSSST